jgi:glutamine synthetase
LEQEYFLIDRSLAVSPDLMMTGRTLLGHTSQGQQLMIIFGYSYALTYMRDLEQECMLLGIPVKRVA